MIIISENEEEEKTLEETINEDNEDLMNFDNFINDPDKDTEMFTIEMDERDFFLFKLIYIDDITQSKNFTSEFRKFIREIIINRKEMILEELDKKIKYFIINEDQFNQLKKSLEKIINNVI